MDLNFTLGEEKTIVSSKISVHPRVEGKLLAFWYFGVDGSFARFHLSFVGFLLYCNLGSITELFGSISSLTFF